MHEIKVIRMIAKYTYDSLSCKDELVCYLNTSSIVIKTIKQLIIKKKRTYM